MSYVNILLESSCLNKTYTGAAGSCTAYSTDGKLLASTKKAVVDSNTATSSLIVLIDLLQDIVGQKVNKNGEVIENSPITHINFIADERPGSKHNNYIKNVIMYSRRWKNNNWVRENGEDVKSVELVEEFLTELDRLGVFISLVRSEELLDCSNTAKEKIELKKIAKLHASKEAEKHAKSSGPIFYSETVNIKVG